MKKLIIVIAIIAGGWVVGDKMSRSVASAADINNRAGTGAISQYLP